MTLICGFGVGKLKPVVDVGLMSPAGVVGSGDGFDFTCVGSIVNGAFMPFCSTQYCIVVVVGGTAVVVVDDVASVTAAARVDVPMVVSG